MLVNMWRFSFFYENYIYYYTHGTVRGLHIALAGIMPSSPILTWNNKLMILLLQLQSLGYTGSILLLKVLVKLARQISERIHNGLHGFIKV